jgi:hypothetical protein
MDTAQNIGPKAMAFIDELEALCIKHGVCLSVSGYDGLQVWDLDKFPSEPIYCPWIEDRTGVTPAPASPG